MSLWCFLLCVLALRRWPRRGPDDLLADRAAATAAAGARHQVPALRSPGAAQWPAGGGGAASRAAGRHDAPPDPHGHRGGSKGQARAGTPGGVAARSGHDDPVRSGHERRRRLHRRGDGRGRGHRPDLREHGRDEGQLRRRAAHAVGDGAASGLCAARDRTAAAADAVGSARQPRRSGVRRQLGIRSPGLRLPSVRHARNRLAPEPRRHLPRRSARVPRALLRPEQRHPRDCRRHHRRGSVCGGKESVRGLGRARPADSDLRGAARSDAARDRGQQAGRGADRSPGGPPGHSAHAPRLHGREPRDPHSGR